MKKTVKMLDGEYWWGGSTAMAEPMPLSEKTVCYTLDMYRGYNQTMPLYVSSLGRYIWSEKPLRVDVSDGEFRLESESEIILESGGSCLKDAYLTASKKHFPFTGKVPPLKFFMTAQYNTWMEYDYNQTQTGVLEYAHGIVDNGYEPGILMIDEGWHTRYGVWEFDRAKFPDPKGMIDELHSLGFTVMLWVTPLHTSDGRDFILAAENDRLGITSGVSNDKELFLRTDDGKVAIVKWWNGCSAILNFCKKDDCDFLDEKLKRLINDYGVDGFKLDGGIIYMYNSKNIQNGTQTKYSPDELNIAWNEFGARYAYHEYKDTFKGGGKGAISRLSDRDHSWVGKGINSILPAALLQGLIGHPFICPDMVGGGEWTNKYKPGFTCDEELFIRMAQLSALFPMIQFSMAPWRWLSEENAKLCLDAARLHCAFGDYLKKQIHLSAVSGEPILRHMEYEYPNSGYAEINDQFLLGSDILVAPVLTKGETSRRVLLPEGKWLLHGKTEYGGGRTVTVDAPLSVLPYFIKKAAV